MSDVSVVFNAVGKDSGVSSLLDKFKSGFKSTGAVGAAAMAVVDHEVEKLNDEIEDAQRNLKQLGRDFALATAGVERASIASAMRKQNTELGKLTKARDLIKPEEVRKAGEAAGETLTSGLMSKIVAANPAIAAAIAGTAIAAAPYIGSTISLAVVGAAAGGGILGGVMIAAKDARVQAAWKSFAAGAKTELQGAAAPFVPAVLGSISIISGAFQRLQPVLRSVFASASTYVKPLADGIAGLIENIGPGFAKAVASAGPVISVLAQTLPRLGTAIGDLFSQAADHADDAAEALGIIMNLITGITAGLATVVGWLGNIADANRAIGGDGLLRLLGLVKDSGPRWMEASTATLGFKAAVDTTGVAAETAAAKIDRLNQATNDLKQANLSLYDAQTRATEAISKANEVLEKNGRTHKTSTAAGRANRDALVSLASAFNTATGANDKANVSATKSERDFGKQRAAFIAAAEKAGYAAGEARKLADRILSIPKARTARIEASTKSAEANVKRVRDLLAGIHNKTVSVNVLIRESQARKVNNTLDRLAGSRAAGGPIRRTLPYLVGENGPEVVIPDDNATVITASKSKPLITPHHTLAPNRGSMLRNAITGKVLGQTQAVVRVEGGDRRIVELIRYLIRTVDLIGNV